MTRSITKLITTNELLDIPIKAITKFDVAHLYELLKRVAVELEGAKHKKQWLEAAIGMKYQHEIEVTRIRLAKDTDVAIV